MCDTLSWYLQASEKQLGIENWRERQGGEEPRHILDFDSISFFDDLLQFSFIDFVMLNKFHVPRQKLKLARVFSPLRGIDWVLAR